MLFLRKTMVHQSLHAFPRLNCGLSCGNWNVVMLFFIRMLMLVQTRDTNSVTNPCEALPRLKAKDAITLAVGFTGDVSKWYNNTNPSGSLLSPCSSKLATQLPVNSKVAVFRPILDQLSIFQISNASYAQLVQDFPGGASLVVYAGNPTIISAPRYFIVPYGRIPQFTLILEFEKGNLIRLLWKDDKCEPCGASSGACFQGSCATQATVCLNMDLSSNVTTDDCRLAVNVAFSGTDKNNELFNSWYQIKSIGQYSLTRLYEKTKNDALNSLFNDFEPLIGSP